MEISFGPASIGLARGLAEMWPRRQRRSIAFHRATWLPGDQRCLLEFAGEGNARAELTRFLRRYLRLDASTTISLVGSGRGALRLGLAALSRLDPGRKKVVVPSYCCTAVVAPVVENGLSPVFIDTGPQLVSEPDQYSAAIADDVLAVLVVNLCGKRLSDPARTQVFNLCRERGVFSIEDNCHYLVPIGAEPRPDMELHSFGFGKVLPATAGGALIARTGIAEVAAELQHYTTEPAGAADTRFSYFMARFRGGVAPPAIEEAYQRARTQYGDVLMTGFDAALALAHAPQLSKTIRRQIRVSKKLLSSLNRHPGTFSHPGVENNIFTRLPVVLRDAEVFNQFWTRMTEERVELEGMYLPLHLKFPELHNGSPLPCAEQVYGRVFNIPNRASLGWFAALRICRVLERFARKLI
jgi:dTDP-4-amino-4,6-dideoxygalactose transaminase